MSVSFGVVPLRLRGHHCSAKGEMVLPELHWVNETAKRTQELNLKSLLISLDVFFFLNQNKCAEKCIICWFRYF